MKNIVVELDKDRGRDRAQDYFLDMCGLYRRMDINTKHLDDSLDTLEDIYGHIQIQAIFSKYDRQCVQGGQLVLDDTVFSCRALSQVPESDILNVYIYLLTVGDVNLLCERVLYQVYYDMWQTAFVDVGRDLLREHIKSTLNYKIFAISDTFGPGFFGMPVADTRKFFEILDAGRIGASINPDGFMRPIKSYAGFFLITDKVESLPSKDCENCVSSGKTCSYCKTGRQRGPVAELELMKGDLFKRRYRQNPVRATL